MYGRPAINEVPVANFATLRAETAVSLNAKRLALASLLLLSCP
jgi:hypothetical protein